MTHHPLLGNFGAYMHREEEKKRKAEEARQAEKDFWESLELRSDAPPLTEGDIVRSVETGKGLWRPLGTSAAEKAAAEAAAERERKEIVIAPTALPEF